MKGSLPKPPPESVPRMNSLRHRLQQAPGQNETSYLDQLMIFLEAPPGGVRDRWKAGAEMCAQWGVATTGTSVWRLRQSYILEWSSRLEAKASLGEATTPEAIEQKVAGLIATRIIYALSHPDLPFTTLLNFARLEQRERALELTRLKREDRVRSVISPAQGIKKHRKKT